MTEPPKPITRLATPIDRLGPRRPNRLGANALASTVTAWLMTGVVAFVGLVTQGAFWPAMLGVGLIIVVVLNCVAVLVQNDVSIFRVVHSSRAKSQ